jgi:hypothetical protein
LRVFDRGKVLLCLNGCEELLEFMVCELGSVIGDDYLWDSKAS